MKPSEHIQLVAILHIAWSALLVMAASIIFIIAGVGGLFAGEEELAYLVVGIAVFLLIVLVVAAVAGFVGAWGLFNRQPWARITVMVLSAVWLIKVPVGTALGIYSLYALTRDEVAAQFEHPAHAPAP